MERRNDRAFPSIQVIIVQICRSRRRQDDDLSCIRRIAYYTLKTACQHPERERQREWGSLRIPFIVSEDRYDCGKCVNMCEVDGQSIGLESISLYKTLIFTSNQVLHVAAGDINYPLM